MSETSERVLSAATRLFAERGYEGISVRAICGASSVPRPGIARSWRRACSCSRRRPSRLAEPGLLSILHAEFQQGFRNCGEEAIAGLVEQNQILIGFLQAAADAGLLREGVDVDMVAGALNERLNTQVMYADNIHVLYGQSIKAPEYRHHWTRQTIDLLLYGAARDPKG